MSNKVIGNKKTKCLLVHFHENTEKYERLPHKTVSISSTDHCQINSTEENGSTEDTRHYVYFFQLGTA